MRALLFINLCWLLQLAGTCCFAQSTGPRSSIGVDFIVNDYQFNPGVKSWSSSRKQLHGVGIHYLHQINSRYQIACMVTGSFTDSVVLKKTIALKKTLIESDVLVQRVLSRPAKIVQPVIGAGIGIQTTNLFSSAYVPMSAGVQVNVTSNVMLCLSAQYRYAVTGPMRSHTTYGIGISGWLPRKRQKTTPHRMNISQTPPLDQAVVDRDHDGIIDTEDRCPDLAGVQDNDGCPQEKAALKESYAFNDSTANLLNTLAKKILFATNSAEIKNESFISLEKIYVIIARYPGLQLLIEGHTDNVGNDRDNLQLSERRAGAVLDYLVKKGIDSTRLKAVGFGESRPVTTNENNEGRAQNRRVVFSKLN